MSRRRLLAEAMSRARQALEDVYALSDAAYTRLSELGDDAAAEELAKTLLKDALDEVGE